MAGIFTAAQIAGFRGLVADLAMPDSYEVLRTVSGQGDYGGQSPATEQVMSSGPCLVREQAGGTELILAGTATVTRPAIIELPVGTDVTESDRLRINGTRRLAVVAIDRGGNLSATLTVLCSDNT